MKKTLLGIVTISSLAAGIITGTSCGRPDDADLDPNNRSTSYTPVDGLAAYGSQCPYGDIGGVKPLRLQMWNCPIQAGKISLNEDLNPLYLQADCRARILNVRTLDHRIDTSWYFLPDGEFDVIVDGLVAKLRSDGRNSDCNAPLAVNITGRVVCGADGPDQDKASIRFQSVMWAGKRLSGHGNSPVVAPSPGPNGLPPPPSAEPVNVSNQCDLPQSCYFYTQTEIKQCQ